MTTTDRYIVRTFVGSYLVLLLVAVIACIFIDLLINVDEFAENALPMREVLGNLLDYYGSNLPLYYLQLGGVTIAIAASFTFGMLLRNNEMTALVAAGVPLQRLAVPALLGSVALVGLWMASNELVVPSLAHKIARRHDDLSGTRQVAVHCVRDEHDAILSAGELHSREGRLRNVYIIEPPSEARPGVLINADSATYDPARRTWKLDRGVRRVMSPPAGPGDLGAPLQRQPLSEYAFGLAPEQILLRQSAQWAGLMSMRQMNALLQAGNLPNKAAVAKSRDVRFTQPLLAWILMVLVVPFFLTREPANVLVAGGKALVLGGLCFGLTFIAHSIPVDAAYMRWMLNLGSCQAR